VWVCSEGPNLRLQVMFRFSGEASSGQSITSPQRISEAAMTEALGDAATVLHHAAVSMASPDETAPSSFLDSLIYKPW
jgi:hypothetical protein